MSDANRRRLVIFLIAGIWAHIETAYFGSNLTPQSGGELVADGVVLLLILVAGVI